MEQNLVAPGVTTAENLVPQAAARGRQALRVGHDAASVNSDGALIGSMQRTASVINMPIMAEGMGMMGGWAVGGLAGLLGFSRASVWIRSTLLAPFLALRKTTWNNLAAFPAHFYGSIHERATEVAEKAVADGKTKLAEAAKLKAAEAGKKAASYAGTVKPLERTVETVAGKAVGIAGKFAAWRTAVVNGYTHVAKAGVAGLPKMMLKAGGRMSVFGSLVALGTTAAISATWLRLHRNRAEDKEVIEQMTQDLGSQGHEYLELVKKASNKQLLANTGKSGLSTLGEVAIAKTVAASQQASVGGGMMAASFLPMILGEAVSENPVRAAYQALGNPQLGKEQKISAIKHLFAIIPSVASHGGLYNRLNHFMAVNLTERGASRTEIIRLAANGAANGAEFNKMAGEMKAVMEAAAAPKGTVKDQPVAATASAIKQEVAHGQVHIHPKAANAPSYKVNSVQPQGTVVQSQRKLG